MSNGYSVVDLLDFLEHSANRGLMPPATATALAVASRNVFGVLEESEKGDVRNLDLDTVFGRFQNKRARDFTPDSLAEYRRRTKKAVQLFLNWKEDPSGFRAPTRATKANRKRKDDAAVDETLVEGVALQSGPGTYQTALPLGPNRVVVLHNVPSDLTSAEAERLAAFVKMLPVPHTP